MAITLISFGKKYGYPKNMDACFEVTNLHNPFWVEELKPLTGLDKPVQSYLDNYQETQETIQHIVNEIGKMVLSNPSITIGICCTGGQHRSPYVTICVGDLLSRNYEVIINHRDIEKRSQ